MEIPMHTWSRYCLVWVLICLSSCSKKVSTGGSAPNAVTKIPSVVNEPFDSHGRYLDSFADLGGAVQSFENGSQKMPEILRTCLVFPFGAASNEPLILRAVEDHQTLGFDGKPGLLAFHWETLPSTLAYSGFVYQGRVAHSIRLPLLQSAKSADDLDKVRLRFRYKALKSDSSGVAFPVKCRVEPNIPDAYAHRLELMTITATGEWQLFDAILGDGSNSKAFLEYIGSEEFDGNFKLSWSQSGPIGSYTGATLMIDDVELGAVMSDEVGK